MHHIQATLDDEYTSLPKDLYSSQSVREMDRYAIKERGVNGFELMNKAARFSFHALIKKWPTTKNLIVVCGSGNNAGDGYIVAAMAAKRGINTTVLFASSPDKLKNDAKSAFQRCHDQEVTFSEYASHTLATLSQQANTVLVDALLGTGLNSKVEGLYHEIIEDVNNLSIPILSIDIPSGLSSDTGNPLGTAIKATITTTYIGLKLGLFTGSGRDYSGNIQFSNLDLPDDYFKHIPALAHRLDLNELRQALANRAMDSHKGHYGHIAVIGGDTGYGGALILATMAAMRVGVGLTTVITQELHRQAILSHIPEAMIHCTQNALEIERLLNKVDTIIIGPGLGQSPWAEKLLLCALNSHKPLVIDADALNLLSKKQTELINLATFKQDQHVLTPHPGEAARLLNISSKQVQADRLKSLHQLHDKWGNTILLKGSGSLISDQKQNLFLCPYGNPGMASGGMGDVLSGLIGGLMAQKLAPEYALKLAVCLHARAADIATYKEGERGLLASDLIPIARALLNARV